MGRRDIEQELHPKHHHQQVQAGTEAADAEVNPSAQAAERKAWAEVHRRQRQQGDDASLVTSIFDRDRSR